MNNGGRLDDKMVREVKGKEVVNHDMIDDLGNLNLVIR